MTPACGYGPVKWHKSKLRSFVLLSKPDGQKPPALNAAEPKRILLNTLNVKSFNIQLTDNAPKTR